MKKHRHHTVFKNTIICFIATFIFVGAPILLANWQINVSYRQDPVLKVVDNIHLPEETDTLRFFAAHGFDLAQIRRKEGAVPGIYLARLPRDLPRLRNSRDRKKLFFATLLPPIVKVNSRISQNRERLKKIILKVKLDQNIPKRDRAWLARMADRYRIKTVDTGGASGISDALLEELLLRMNVIPPALALAQAAQESGWGTSRFAQKGNAIYGQWTWGDGCGMVPRERSEGKTHRMKCFSSVIEAVDSYMLNLNTHRAYAALRQKRRTFRDDQTIKVMPLVETLSGYSEEGEDYVEKIKTIIRVNRLTDFRDVRLIREQY